VTQRLAGGRLYAAAIGVSLGAVAAALVTQHVFEMQPCPWCVLQRLEFVAIAASALPGLLLSRKWVRRGSAALMLALAGAGVATALWQHFVAAASASCRMTLADQIIRGLGLDELLPTVFAAYASCADGAARIFGVPYEFYSLTLFALLFIAAGWGLRRRA
jgi:disulfide bond formation protein DsbB